jgi:hypothetical protein
LKWKFEAADKRACFSNNSSSAQEATLERRTQREVWGSGQKEAFTEAIQGNDLSPVVKPKLFTLPRVSLGSGRSVERERRVEELKLYQGLFFGPDQTGFLLDHVHEKEGQ